MEQDNIMIGCHSFGEIKKAAETVRETIKFMYDKFDEADKESKDNYMAIHAIIILNDIMASPMQKVLSDKFIRHLENKKDEAEKKTNQPLASFGISSIQN